MLLIDGTPYPSGNRTRHLVYLDRKPYPLQYQAFFCLTILAIERIKEYPREGMVSLARFFDKPTVAFQSIYRLRHQVPLDILTDGTRRYWLDYPVQEIGFNKKQIQRLNDSRINILSIPINKRLVSKSYKV
jgi:hypothetical protein